MKAEASAPSNIALIKYMGKVPVPNGNQTNLPANASLSYTLEHLRSFVTIEPNDSKNQWQPLENFPELKLSDVGKEKFLAHFQRLKAYWRIEGTHTVRSANNFPADCGLASSASSFAALTQATAALSGKSPGSGKALTPAILSRLSRQGSGSSCRSFFSPWALWRDEAAEPVDIKLKCQHAVVIVADAKKTVSSSEAHARVPSSLLFSGRSQRAEARTSSLMHALRSNLWKSAFEICWAEFWDMHALFHTSHPSFGYMTSDSLSVLEQMRTWWNEKDDGPLVTMDAGANIHLLLRDDQCEEANQRLSQFRTIKSWDAHV